MTVDLLSLRIKEAKRELTALKTAHKRGLGLLKVFEEEITITAPNPGYYANGRIIVNFSQELAPYPFTYILGYGGTVVAWYVISAEIETISYTNNGYTMIFTGSFVYQEGYIPDKIKIVSTSIPTSVSFEWSN